MSRAGPRGRRAVALTIVLGAALAACAAIAPQVHKLPDGGYQIACDDTLSSCLGAFETICEWHGYDVISATERRRHADLRDVPDVTIHSEAEVRCKPGEALFGNPPAPPGPPPEAAALPPAAPPAPPPRAVPGADGGATDCGTPPS